MFDKRLSRGLLIVPMLLWAAACSDTPNDPADAIQDTQVNLDVARYAADQATDDIAMMTYETAGVFGGPMAGPPGGGMHGFGFDGSLSVTRTVTFYDADTVMAYFDADITDMVNFYFLLDGERTRTSPRGTMTMEVYRERDMTVSGLDGQETQRQWDGSGETSKERTVVSDEHGDRNYEMSSTSTITAVVIPVPRTEDSWPLDGGTIERTVHAEFVKDGETRTRDCTVLITFNGTQFVPIVVNGVEYTLDLATKKIVEDADGS